MFIMQAYLASAAARWAAARHPAPPGMIAPPSPPSADAAFVAAAAAARPASIPGLGAALGALAARLRRGTSSSPSAPATTPSATRRRPPARRLGHAAGPTDLSAGLVEYIPVAAAKAARPVPMVVAGSGTASAAAPASLPPRDAVVVAVVAVLAARHAAHVAATVASAHKRRRLDADVAAVPATPYALPGWYTAAVVPAVVDRRVAAAAAVAAAVAADAAAVADRYALAPDMVSRRVASKRYARARRLRAAAAAADAQTEAAAAAEMHRRRAVAGVTDAVQSGARGVAGGGSSPGATVANAPPGTPAGLVAFRYDRGEGAFAYSGGICGGGAVRRRQLAKYATVAEVAGPAGVAGAVGFAKTAPMFHTKVMNRWA